MYWMASGESIHFENEVQSVRQGLLGARASIATKVAIISGSSTPKNISLMYFSNVKFRNKKGHEVT